MTTELRSTQVDLSGLLEVLGKNLYSTPAVAVRELIQNAHDACIRHTLEVPEENSAYRIDLTTAANHTLVIEDNGSGLTHNEIVEYLATVGSGYTRVLRQQTNSDAMIGYFGLGFLAAYVVAEKVEVWTTSYQTPDQGWHFTSAAKGLRFTLEPVAAQPIGTRVKLQLAPEFHDLAVADVLVSLLKHYACLLKIPIHINANPEPINHLTAPWLLDPEQVSPLARRKRELEFASLFEQRFEPICVIPIPSDNDCQCQGLIWIQDASGYATSDYRNVSVFVRSMHISQAVRELLPLWAGFVGCIVDSHQLTPTASREDIQKDHAFDDLQALLTETLINALRDLAQANDATWRRIVKRHNQALLGAAVSDERLFEVLKDELKVPTSLGEMTLPALCKRTQNKIYIRLDDKSSYEDVLFRAQHIPVVAGYLFAASTFCQQYGTQSSAQVIELGTQKGNQALFSKTVAGAEQTALQSLLAEANEEVVCTRFQPVTIPLVLVEDQEVKLKHRLEQDEADKRIGAAALSLARLHTQTISDEIHRRLFVNLEAPLIQRLLSLNSPQQQALARLLRAFAVTLTQDTEGIDFIQELEQFSDSLLTLIDSQQDKN